MFVENKEVLEKLKDIERVIEFGVHNEDDLRTLSDLFQHKREYSRWDTDFKRILSNTLVYFTRPKDNSTAKRAWETTREEFEQSREIVEFTPQYESFEEFIYFADYWYRDNSILIRNNFLDKCTYINEEIYSLWNLVNLQNLSKFSKNEDNITHVLMYYLKKKHNKSDFRRFLYGGIITAERLRKIKLTDKQFTEFIYSEFKQLLKRRVSLSELTTLKNLKPVSELITPSVFLEITNKFIKDAEKSKVSAASIEVILIMFLHYMGKSIEEFPDSELILTLSIEKEIELK